MRMNSYLQRVSHPMQRMTNSIMLSNQYSSFCFALMLRHRFSTVLTQPTIHSMNRGQLAIARQWAVQEGWNPGKHEAKPFLAADPKGYWMANLLGRPIACLAGVRYQKIDQPYFAWLGSYIVRSEYRGQGYGKCLWDHTREQLSDYKTIGLHAVLKQVETYQKDGFEVPHDQALNTRWVHQTKPKRFYHQQSDIEVLSLKDVFNEKPHLCMNHILEYDTRIFSTNRANFLKSWLNMPRTKVFFAFDGNDIIGYGALSATEEGYTIAPLFAKNAEVAEALYLKLLKTVPENSAVFVDTTALNSTAESVLRQIGFQEVFQTCSMYTTGSDIPSLKHDEIFAMTSLEISP